MVANVINIKERSTKDKPQMKRMDNEMHTFHTMFQGKLSNLASTQQRETNKGSLNEAEICES